MNAQESMSLWGTKGGGDPLWVMSKQTGEWIEPDLAGDYDRAALFDVEQIYRYALFHRLPVVENTKRSSRIAWVLLNPSKADAFQDDPTVTRLRVRSSKMGFHEMVVLNIFAFRSTDPDACIAADDPVGALNDDCIAELVAGADQVVVGWGHHGRRRRRGREVAYLIEECGVDMLYLGNSESPKEPPHPLYISYDVRYREFIPQVFYEGAS